MKNQRQRHFRTSLIKRALAVLIDVLPLQLAALFICQEFFNLSPFVETDPTLSGAAHLAALHGLIVMTGIVLLVWLCYGTLAEASPMRATFGKRLFGLRVCGLTGGPLTFSQTVIRNFSKLVSLLPCGLGFLWAILSHNNRAWHDLFAKAVVIEERY